MIRSSKDFPSHFLKEFILEFTYTKLIEKTKLDVLEKNGKQEATTASVLFGIYFINSYLIMYIMYEFVLVIIN